ncbi:MAG: aminotransferase class I/II-fold pyridoxal phosphate-dependent enzyme [Chitinivibrionales bacterium]|nr:aminotransferase class I/II-fold pyridoxal phosphate-dependent enzyme [Chitinivibrionales bacterium]
MTPIHERIESSLKNRKSAALFRSVASPVNEPAVDLSHNSYLNLHANAEVSSAAAYLCGNCYSGNTASRLIATRSPLYDKLESEITAWKGTETALVFNSGYAANIGILQAVCSRDTAVFCDRLNHASLIDGIILSRARLHRYDHCNIDDLYRQLKQSGKHEKLIVTDTVFSMDGDRAPLGALCELARTFGAMIMVDEAHATGVFGKSLAGLAEETGTEDMIDIRMGTLSKAIAGLGGFFAGSGMLRDYLVNNARSLIYSTALPHPVLAHNIAAIRHIRSNPGIGKRLCARADAFRGALNDAGFNTRNSSTHIIPVIAGSATEALHLGKYLEHCGIHVPSIRPPTVPEGTARVRFSVHTCFTEKQMHIVVQSLKKWKPV